MIGALRQIAVYQRTAELQGMSRERRRVARDLHDGPVQDLALVQVLLSQVATRTSDPALRQVDAATARARREWRLAVSNLVVLDERPPRRSSRRSPNPPSGAAGSSWSSTSLPAIVASQAVRRHLVYVLREALSNVVRHAGARQVRVSATTADGFTLVVADDGRGFAVEPDGQPGDGAGLRSMRERARMLGARCTIVSDERGTRVTFVVPARALRAEDHR